MNGNDDRDDEAYHRALAEQRAEMTYDEVMAAGREQLGPDATNAAAYVAGAAMRLQAPPIAEALGGGLEWTPVVCGVCGCGTFVQPCDIQAATEDHLAASPSCVT